MESRQKTGSLQIEGEEIIITCDVSHVAEIVAGITGMEQGEDGLFRAPLSHWDEVKTGLKGTGIVAMPTMAALHAAAATYAEREDIPDIDTQIVKGAKHLYEAGFNILPVPRVNEQAGSKPPYGGWAMLQQNRLHPSSIPTLFRGANVAVLCGKTSQNLVVIDCDSEDEFAKISARLGQMGIKTWVRNSTRGGQFWFLCREGDVRPIKRGKIDVLGAGSYVVAPPSVHPTGMLYEWLEQPEALPTTIGLKQLGDILGAELHLFQLEIRDGDDRNLPKRAHEILVMGETGRYDGDNSHAELVACQSLVAAGYTDERIYEIFCDTLPPHFEKRNQNREWLETHIIAPAREYCEANPVTRTWTQEGAAAAMTTAAAIRNWAAGRQWKGATGATDSTVLMCLTKRMEKDGTVFRASLRELSVMANIGKAAIISSLSRLKGEKSATPLIMYVRKSSESGAALYQFCMDNIDLQDDHAELSAFSANSAAHDAFCHRALGKTGLLIRDTYRLHRDELNAMPKDSDRVNFLSEKTGKCKKTIRKFFAKIIEIAESAEGAGESQIKLDFVAAYCNTDGVGKKRKVLYLEERMYRTSAILQNQRKEWEAKFPHLLNF